MTLSAAATTKALITVQSFPVARKLKILARGKYRADVKGRPYLRSAVPSPGIFLIVVDQQLVVRRSGHKPYVVHTNAQVSRGRGPAGQRTLRRVIGVGRQDAVI